MALKLLLEVPLSRSKDDLGECSLDAKFNSGAEGETLKTGIPSTTKAEFALCAIDALETGFSSERKASKEALTLLTVAKIADEAIAVTIGGKIHCEGSLVTPTEIPNARAVEAKTTIAGFATFTHLEIVSPTLPCSLGTFSTTKEATGF